LKEAKKNLLSQFSEIKITGLMINGSERLAVGYGRFIYSGFRFTRLVL
jgi:hypothetical protein